MTSLVETIKAGVVVFRESEKGIEILLVYRKKQDDWSFPKGHVESGEGIREAALRELAEETNVHLKNLKRLPDLTYVDDTGRPVRVMFHLGADHGSKLKKQTKKDNEKPCWVRLADVERQLSHENLRTYFKNFIFPLLDTKDPAQKSGSNL